MITTEQECEIQFTKQTFISSFITPVPSPHILRKRRYVHCLWYCDYCHHKMTSITVLSSTGAMLIKVFECEIKFMLKLQIAYMWLQSIFKLQIGQILTMPKSNQSGAWAWTWSQTQKAGQQIRSKIESFQNANFLISQPNPMMWPRIGIVS